MKIQKKLNFLFHHLSNFWRTLDMPLINCEVSLTLTGSKNWVTTDETTQDADPYVDPPVPEIRAPEKTGFKRTIKRNKYRPEIINQDKNANLNYLIDPTFSKVNRLFALPFKNENENENDRVSSKKILCT